MLDLFKSYLLMLDGEFFVGDIFGLRSCGWKSVRNASTVATAPAAQSEWFWRWEMSNPVRIL